MAVLDKCDDSVKEGSLDGDNEGGCNAKTPVSLLQELYVRRGITPKYDLVQIEGAVHEPTFKYRVTIGEFVATGCGQSKKKAKHSAAKSILDKLLGAQNAGIAPPGQPTIPDLAQDIFSPYDDGIEGNPVGILQELCMSRRWPPPTYELNHEEGLPHERSFVMVCVINKHRETGLGKSKKLAKRQAANRMIKKLQMLPSENEDGNQNIDEDDLAQGLVVRLKETNTRSSGGNQSQVNKFHRVLKNLDGEYINKLHSDTSSDVKNEEAEADFDDPCRELLENIAIEQKFEVTYVDVEELSKKGLFQCLVQLSTVPVAVCFGSGESEVEARTAAAENALEYLRIMTRK